MEDFILHLSTRYIFGKDSFSHISKEAKKFGSKVLVLYGGGSIKQNGVYSRVMEQLQGFEVKEFSGIEPNPRIETLRKAVQLAREFQPDILLAVGGGSVIDGTKLVSAATYYDGDAWEVIEKKNTVPAKYIPIGTVLTISATASEFNGGSVITNWETHTKDYFSTQEVKPVFTVLDPQVMYSLPAAQTAYGIIDAYSHILEQYITTTFAPVQDRISEGLLLTLVEWGPIALKDPRSYDARANIAYTASLALNDLTGSGVNQDWATHQLEHVVSAYYDIPHAAGLAIITPRWMEVVGVPQKLGKMAQYGKRVFGLTGTDPEVARQAILRTYQFFSSLGVKMNFADWNIPESAVTTFAHDASRPPMGPPGEFPLTKEQITEIYQKSFSDEGFA